jgi:hypothetical protein
LTAEPRKDAYRHGAANSSLGAARGLGAVGSGLEVCDDGFGFGVQRQVLLVPDPVHAAAAIAVKAREQGIEGRLLGSVFCNEFKRGVGSAVRRQTVDEDAGDLVSGDDPVGGVSGVAGVALKQGDLELVVVVVVEPARSHDCVGVTVGADEAFAAAFPVVVLARAVTPMAVISAIRARRPSRAVRILRTPA